MNTENLHISLQQSFSADANLRLPAEQIIKNLKHVSGSTKMLLEIATEKQVNIRFLVSNVSRVPSMYIFSVVRYVSFYLFIT